MHRRKAILLHQIVAFLLFSKPQCPIYLVLSFGTPQPRRTRGASVIPHRLAGLPVLLAQSVKGGFGANEVTRKKSGKNKRKVEATPLSDLAIELLKKHGDNVDSASSDYFNSRMEHYHGSRASGSSEGTDEQETCAFEARMKATWDTVALFLPHQYAGNKKRNVYDTDDYLKRRLELIARACFFCRDTANDQAGAFSENAMLDKEQGKTWSVLDVGCGDGSILPYLEAEASRANGNNDVPFQYLGLDISPNMIDLGRAQHPTRDFVVGSFSAGLPHSRKYDCVLFNGSLQFFRDTSVVLQQAAEVLKNRSNGKYIVIAHVNGARFVTNECRTNPFTAVQGMPTYPKLVRLADELGLAILTKVDVFASEVLSESDASDQSFYLYVLKLK